MNKYRNKPTKIDGYRFMSTKEANYYLYLKQQLSHGYITDLELQPVYPIVISGHRVCKTILDFRYKDKRTGKTHHVDVKGMDLPLSKIKRKLAEILYNFEVEIV